MRLHHESKRHVDVNVIPLIDVMFALLTFFVISTLFLTKSQGLPVNLPTASTAKAERPAQVTVTVNAKGDMFFNKEPIQIEALEAALKAKVQPNKDLLVVLNADGDVTHKQVVAVMDRVRKVPGAKFAIATKS